ncbi:hypothetical protein [Bacillus sp. AFS002410]
MYADRNEKFSNSRPMRNLLQKSITSQSTRVIHDGLREKRDLMRLTSEDI